MRVLFVCPHFAPTNAPDGHRVRLLLPHCKDANIEAEVLTVEPDATHFPRENWLLESLPPSLPIHRTTARSKQWGCVPGLGSLSFRAIPGLRAKGDELLSQRPFDLIYFSTTQFGTHLLAPYWKRKHGVPFCMDFQDPWVNDYYRNHPDQTPPGGKVKFTAADYFNRTSEPKVLAECSGITSVSPAYPKALAARYANSPQISNQLFEEALVIPFPAEKAELERVKESSVSQSIFDPSDGNQHWVYTGRCGPYMEKSIRSLFRSIQVTKQNHPNTGINTHLHFIGTSYASGANDSPIAKAAAEFGLAGCVHEASERIPLSESIRTLLDADALIIPGSDDPGYNASKIYPYLLAEKPLLAVFHQESPVTQLIGDLGGGVCVPFRDEDSESDLAQRIATSVFSEGLTLPAIPIDQEKFEAHTAKHQATLLHHFFNSVLQTERKLATQAA